MRQLDLFGAPAPPPPAPTPAPEPEPLPLEFPDVLPGQIGLFDPRSLLLGRARAAVAGGDLEAACRDLDTLIARAPGDAAITRERLEIRSLRERLARIEGPRVKQRGRRLLGLAAELAGAAEPLSSLRRRLLARVADEIRREQGDGGELEGRLAGEYLADGGELGEACAALAAAFAARRDARSLFPLADVTFQLGDIAAARRLYLHALLRDPFQPALRGACDEAVRALPDVVRYELEIDDDPEAFVAPAGILDGLLPRLSPEEMAALPPPPEALSPQKREALSRARAFVEALAAAGAGRGEAIIELRRTMKRLSPELFARYMDRVVRSRPG